jgi:hypothetical protein
MTRQAKQRRENEKSSEHVGAFFYRTVPRNALNHTFDMVLRHRIQIFTRFLAPSLVSFALRRFG